MPIAALPVEEHLDLVISLARTEPTRTAYEAFATERGLRVERDPNVEGQSVLLGNGIAVLVIEGRLARVHAMSLCDDLEQGEAASSRGIALTSSCDDLPMAFAQIRERLESRLGAPEHEDDWTSDCLLDDEHEHTHRCCAWALDQAVLVLLHEDEGDAHLGELATVDLRIAPRAAEANLPDSVRGPLAWPPTSRGGL